MERTKSFVSEIKSRGQITIPKKIRDIMNFEEGQVVTFIPTGNSIIMTPKRLELDDARRQIRKIMKQSGYSIDEIIEGLTEERSSLFNEVYGKKAD